MTSDPGGGSYWKLHVTVSIQRTQLLLSRRRMIAIRQCSILRPESGASYVVRGTWKKYRSGTTSFISYFLVPFLLSFDYPLSYYLVYLLFLSALFSFIKESARYGTRPTT